MKDTSLFADVIRKRGLPGYVYTGGSYMNKLLWAERDGLYDFDGNFMISFDNIDDGGVRDFNLLEHYNL